MVRRVSTTYCAGEVNICRVLDLADGGVDGPGEAFCAEEELCVDAVRVAARILAMPGPVEVDRDQPVHTCPPPWVRRRPPSFP